MTHILKVEALLIWAGLEYLALKPNNQVLTSLFKTQLSDYFVLLYF
jgi:hypothetical protein